MAIAAATIDRSFNRLSVNAAVNWIHDKPVYRKRWDLMSKAARRKVLEQPITLFDVQNQEAMLSIFDKAEDLVRESEQHNAYWDAQVECRNCPWKGKRKDLIPGDHLPFCPSCKAEDSLDDIEV